MANLNFKVFKIVSVYNVINYLIPYSVPRLGRPDGSISLFLG